LHQPLTALKFAGAAERAADQRGAGAALGCRRPAMTAPMKIL
jgi:hypothetical protein